MWSAASKFYLLMCRHTRSSVKVKRDVGRIGGWGGGVESNLPSRRGWTRSYFNFNSGGGVQLYFKAYFANFRTPPLPPDNYCTVPYEN